MDGMSKFGVPVAIVLAGGLIATALYFTNSTAAPAADPNSPTGGTVMEEIRGVQADDHIVGNPNAPVVIVEYSDTECPFCKQYHQTMHTLIDEYGADGQVAWVYRHFPLAQLHSKAPKQAEALECAGELGGNDGFWAYTDRLYATTPANNGYDNSKLPDLAAEVGLDKAAFTTCLDSGKHALSVQEDYEEAVAAGGRGTPHSIILFGGEQFPIEGAQPLDVLKGLIDTMLADA
jgi:protein-disulfide isomerase